MTIQPLPKDIFDSLIAAGENTLRLEFSGGSDEGHLYIGSAHSSELESRIEDWADEAYPYSGAGDGTDYGDDIEYDLVAMTATHQDWTMVREDGEESAPAKFKVKKK
jgi:hypothetical protein